MKFFLGIYNSFFVLLIFLGMKSILSEIKDNFIEGILEDGDNDLLDVTDYHDLNLIVSKSKNIYTGIPPQKIVETDAELISSTYLITINNNFLLAACLQNSFLGKISLTDGRFTSLLDYNDPRFSEALDVPMTICSLSNMDQSIFIGYSKKEYFEQTHENNKTNIIFKSDITNKDDEINGPIIESSAEIKIFKFPNSTSLTSSSRQISCEPLRIKGDSNNGYRLVCMHEGYFKERATTFKNMVYVVTIKEDLSNFEDRIREFLIESGTKFFSFRIYRENDTFARCMTSDKLVEIYIAPYNSKVRIEEGGPVPEILKSYKAEIDLYSYNNKLRFSLVKETSFMGKKNIYSFQINNNYYTNYFKLYNYEESVIYKTFGYFSQEKNKIILLYQTDTSIKYFIMDYMIDIFDFKSYDKTFYLGSYEVLSYDLNDLITTSTLSDLGYLNVMTYKVEGEPKISYGKDFFETWKTNNIFNPEPSLNYKEIYTFSFIDDVENKYTRIYYLSSMTIRIQTCETGCNSCWYGYYNCTDCNTPGYAILEDRPGECFPSTYIVENYIYDNTSNKFLKCHELCEFCSENAGTDDSQKCISCFPSYIYSYVNLGNCYEYPNLEITEDKMVSSNKFISATCSKYKIAATGECVDECPSTSPYYTYIYNNVSQYYEKVNNKSPKYIYKGACHEECPNNYDVDSDNNCVCNNAFYKASNDEDITCLPDDNCSNEYPYKNINTKECYDSLEKCTYFFRDDCYDNCPEGTVELLSQSSDIQTYIQEKLSLDNSLISKICICDTTNGVWSNINEEKVYFQKCLSSCPYGYDPENISKQCLRNNLPTTIPQTTIPLVVTTTILDIKETTVKIIEPTTMNIGQQTSIPISPSSTSINIVTTPIQTNIISSDKVTEEITTPPIPPPHIPINDKPNCPTSFEDRCYPECPPGTCLTQEDPKLKTCVRIGPNTQIFNGICFEHFESLTKNIKAISENNNIIETGSGIIIRGYSLSPKDPVDKNAKYSIVNLGDCEHKLRSYYNLTNETELFILGVDSPNKDPSAITNTYNYGVYLEDGTLLDHNEVCKESKISVSSPITNPELIKLNEAIYFAEMGYDIFDKNSNFYSDVCTPVSIDGNDVILSDRQEDFYPSGVSLCNDSCSYSQVDFETKRFTCECDLVYNFSQKEIVVEEETEEEEDVSYIEYFLSLINYKIIKCYKLFLDYESYYYNAGFYIAVGNFIFCIIQIIIFIKWGLKRLNINILENVPNKMKLQKLLKEQAKKNNEIEINSKIKDAQFKDNPPKKHIMDEVDLSDAEQRLQKNEDNKIKKKNKKSLAKELHVKFEKEEIYKDKSKNGSKKRQSKKNNSSRIISEVNYSRNNNSNFKANYKKNENLTLDEYYTSDNLKKFNFKQTKRSEDDQSEEIDPKEINIIPYFEAIRFDERNYAQMLLSVIFSEIKIIRIFYYKNTFEHLSIILSEYTLELCLDLTLNCLLYTEDVISEKYNNNGSIKFFTTLSLSFMSNIISSIISFFISKLADYVEFFELIIHDVTDKSSYFLNMLKFKKLLCIKLTAFFIIQSILNLIMCYYLMIFCALYHKTQGSIMINYLTGIAESMAISIGLSLITSLLRYLSLRCRWKSIYYTSKFFFEKF